LTREADRKMLDTPRVPLKGPTSVNQNLPDLPEADSPGYRPGAWRLPGFSAEHMAYCAEQILAAVSDGQAVTSFLKKTGLMEPSYFWRWVRADKEFAKAYALARQEQAYKFAEEVTEIADSAQGLDNAGVNAARLRVDTRKWVAARVLPKVFGDRVEMEHTGGISIAGVSAALKMVKPVMFDENGNEIEEAEVVDPPAAPASLDDLL
jgi:hypothetical protein